MEFSMRRINALLKKEIKSLTKNVNVLFMCLLPIMFSYMYTNIFAGDGGIETDLGKIQILIMCISMNLTLVASFVIATLIAEEKEKNTLRTLMLSGVSPLEFFAGKVIVTFLASVIINISMFFIIGMDIKHLGIYIILTSIVALSFIEIGAVIGMISPNQMATGVVGMPVLMIFLIIPLFAYLSETLKKIAVFLPNYNMNIMLEKAFADGGIGIESANNIAAILIWIVIAAVAFIFTYNKVGLDK